MPSDKPHACPGTWLASCNLRKGRDALSLLRAEPADAAACAETRRIQVIFDGVLQNRHELIGALELAPEASDALVAAKAYERWGEEFVLKLKGIFAVAVWDRANETLWCARDPLGTYPLYYSEAGGELLLSTCVDELIRHPAVPRTVNRAALADRLLYRWPDPEELYYEKVRRVFPGNLMRVDRSGRHSARYWDPLAPGRSVNWIREEELGRFDELFAEAVRFCLSFGPAGIFLSGGLDSVSVAALAADECRRSGTPPPWALSIVFPHPECNEETVQRGVAESLGLPQELLPFDGLTDGAWFGAAVEMSRGWPMPLLNTWNPAYYGLALAGLRRGCRVLLTGAGGDEWLGVTPYLAADLIRALDFRGLYQLWGAQRRSFQAPGWLLLRNLTWTFGLRPMLRDLILRSPGGRLAGFLLARRRLASRRKLPEWVAPDPALRRELDQRAAIGVEPNPVSSHYYQEGRSGFDHSLTATEMEEAFENGRRTGTWFLHPYTTPEVIDFLCWTPPPFLNRGGRSKGLVREWLARRFPELGFDSQRKISATAFYRARVLSEGPVIWRQMGGPRALAELGLLDGGQAELLLKKILEKRHAEAYRIWDILSLEAWVRPRR